MKHFLKNCVLFCIILSFINLGLHRFAVTHYYGEYQRIPDYSYTEFLFADSHGTPLGNTPNAYGVYNFSAGSDSYHDMERKIEWLIANGYNIRTIYLSADPHLMSPYRERRNNLDRSNFYLTPNLAENPYEYFKKHFVEQNAVIFQPKVRQLLRSYIIAKIRELLTGTTSANAEPVWNELSTEQRTRKAKYRIHYQYPVEETSTILGETVARIAQRCRENGITIIALKFPVTREYLTALGERGTSAGQLFHELGIPVHDFSTTYSDDPSLFHNQDHLTGEGAARFTRSLFGTDSSFK